jgi:hypothetical protein
VVPTAYISAAIPARDEPAPRGHASGRLGFVANLRFVFRENFISLRVELEWTWNSSHDILIHEKYVDSGREMTHFVNSGSISNQAATQHFYAPVYLSVFLTMLFQQGMADMSPSTTQWKQSCR